MHQIISSAKRGLSRHTGRELSNTGKVHDTRPPRANRLQPIKANDKARRNPAVLKKIAELKSRRALSRSTSPAGFGRVFRGPKLTQAKDKYSLCFRPFVRSRNLVATGDPTDSSNIHVLSHSKMKTWVRILSTPTADTPGTTLLLHFDNKRYLIGNVSEGTQRICVQLGVSSSKVEDIFLTGSVDWGRAGGLIGMVLTLADATASSTLSKAENLVARGRKAKSIPLDEPARLRLHGGRNLTHLLATTRRFVFRKGMPVDVHEIRTEQEPKTDWQPTWSDRNVKVWAMAVQSDMSLSKPRGKCGDEVPQPNPSTKGRTETKEEKEDRDDQIRHAVVGHMFDSDWRLDSLREMKLRDVERPLSTALFFRNSEGQIEPYKGMIPVGDDPALDVDVLTRTPWPGANIASLPPTSPSTEALSYIIKSHPHRGKFDPHEAIRLGVKPGPAFRQLTKGESVTTEDGRIVSSDMVLGPTKDGEGLAIVDLPDASYINPLLNRPEWSSEEIMKGIGGFVWILGPGISDDARLIAFMERFRNLRHVVSSVDLCSDGLVLSGATTAALKLNLLDSKFFPVPSKQSDALSPPKPQPGIFTTANAGMVFQLEPTFEFQEDMIQPPLDPVEAVKDMNKKALNLARDAHQAYEKARSDLRRSNSYYEIPGKDVEVITLGTGSALPSKYRNVSATLVRAPSYGSYLFDCGENTLGQLKRVFGTELPQVLRDLKVIWISHLHADHHLGTTSVIRAWNEETLRSHETESKKLIVASDNGMLEWLTEYSQVENYGFDRLTLISMGSSKNYRHTFSESESAACGVSSIDACPVNHCKGALATVFTLSNGFKVAYSGDCLPSDKFARLGFGATLLIHEATFDDDMAEDALAKKHSTTSGALAVGKAMRARRILLTHFSQRYQNTPLIVDDEEVVVEEKEEVMAADKGTEEDIFGKSEEGGNESQVKKRRKPEDVQVILGFDYMRCTLQDFGRMAALRPALAKLYQEKEAVVDAVFEPVVEPVSEAAVAAVAS